jgi:threonine dehydrogenase-like Zn-dependent dehydrogenase
MSRVLEECPLARDAVRRELSLLFSYSCNYTDYQMALDLLGSGAIDSGPLLSKYPLENAPRGFRGGWPGPDRESDPRPLRREMG